MHKAYAATQDSGRGPPEGWTLGQGLADAVGDRFHLELRAGDLLQQLVGRRALSFRPELLQQRPGLARREPVRSPPRAHVVTNLGLERPRAEVRGHVEPV